MKKKYIIFLLLLAILKIESQTVFNTELIKKIETENLNQLTNVLVLTKPKSSISFIEIHNYILHYQIGDIYSITTSLENIKKLAQQKNIIRIECATHHLILMDDTSDVKNRIAPIKSGLLPLTQSYDGTNIIIGIIDSGTDFNHPDLKDVGGNSRIKFLWDMTKPIAANTPTSFGYGQEWTNSDIDLGLCTHTDLAHFGHGTNSAGIAAGNGLAINYYSGVAPKADIIVVALDFNSTGFVIADAVQYIIAKANALNKPLVINASVGDYYGSHDGTDLETKVIESMITGPGKCLVASAGNAGSIPFHVGYNISTADTNFSWIQSSNSTLNIQEYADTLQIKNVKYTIGANNLSFTNLGNINFKPYNYALGSLKKDTLYHGLHRIGIIESIASINSFGVYELNLTIKPDSLNYLWRIEHSGSGRIDSWNFDYVTTSLPSISVYPRIVKYKNADTTQTIVSGFQCSNEVITVGNYVNRNKYIDVASITQTTTETPGEIAASSSVGPSRDNRIKPDITATGSTILASTALGLLPNLIANYPFVVAQGGFHVTSGGTSASSPVVAGLAALYLQKHPTANNQNIKQAIINCAYTDFFTTLPVPNNRWGYGKLDGLKTMTCGEIPLNISFDDYENKIKVFPNPLTDEAIVTFESNNTKTIKLFNASGQIILTEKINTSNYKLNCRNLAAGLYLLISEENNYIHRIKVLVL